MPRIRLHFTADDLARTRIAPEPHPTWELTLSLHKMRSARPYPRFAGWREFSLPVLNEPAHRRHVELLTALVPPRGNFPDFLTPARGEGGFAAVLDDVLSTPKQRLRAEMTQVPRCPGRRPAADELADGTAAGVRRLGEALSWYHNAVVQPHWSAVRRSFGADRGTRVHDVSEGGVERLLTRLPTCVRWQEGVLEFPYPVERDLRLGGRGLSLIPSYFCAANPVTLIDPELPPVLVYPADDPQTAGVGLGALAALLGDTRARVLRAVRVPRSTTSVAEHVHTSAASASKHAAVLREAGLLTSTRTGHAVLHTVTPLGQSLLDFIGGG